VWDTAQQLFFNGIQSRSDEFNPDFTGMLYARECTVKMKLKLLPLALLAVSECVFAQQVPGAGTQLNQLPPPAPPQTAEPQIRIEKATSPALPGAASVSVLVNDLQFSGAHVYTSAELLKITGFMTRSQLTLA